MTHYKPALTYFLNEHKMDRLNEPEKGQFLALVLKIRSFFGTCLDKFLKTLAHTLHLSPPDTGLLRLMQILTFMRKIVRF